jgi:hypothetical protein
VFLCSTIALTKIKLRYWGVGTAQMVVIYELFLGGPEPGRSKNYAAPFRI